MSKLKSPESLRLSGYGSTAFTSPQKVSAFQLTQPVLRRNKSESGPSFSNRFHRPLHFTRRNYSVRTESNGVSACLGVDNHVQKHMPADPSILSKSLQRVPTSSTTPHADITHLCDRAEAKKYHRYTPTYGSTAFAGYNLASPSITSKRLQNELMNHYDEHEKAHHEKIHLEELDTPRGKTLNKEELQQAYETPMKSVEPIQEAPERELVVPKDIQKLIQLRNIERKKRACNYFDQLKQQAEDRRAVKQLEKDSDKVEARASLGLNYECYRRDEFMAQEKRQIPSQLKNQILEKVLQKANEKHGLIREKHIKDEELRGSDQSHLEISRRLLFDSPLKQSVSKIKAEPERASQVRRKSDGQEDRANAQRHALEYALRDGLMSRVSGAVILGKVEVDVDVPPKTNSGTETWDEVGEKEVRVVA